MLHRLHNELKLPVYCLLDNDPWGYYIYSVVKQGSINLAFESTRMAIPDATLPRACGSIDFERCQLSNSVKINLNDTRHQAGQADRRLSLVRRQEGLAERNRPDARQRLQAGSRVADLERHQLRHRSLHARADGDGRLAGLSGQPMYG